MLTRHEFEMIKNIHCSGVTSISEVIIEPTGYASCLSSLQRKDLEQIYTGLSNRGYIRGFALTDLGVAELNTHKVQNAVILAAGGLEMSPKLLYSIPKGLYKVNGEPIVERLIKQLRCAGVDDIYVVVGYKKDMYFYLEDKYDIQLLVNQQPKKNNVFSLWAASHILNNTYICNSDTYYPHNPFELYVYDSYHATMDKCDTSRELGVTCNSDNRIISLSTGKGQRECLYGHAYFNSVFSLKMSTLINQEIFDFRVDCMFWQEFYAKHIVDLDIFARKYDTNFIREFDTIQELQQLDDMFIENISDDISKKICSTLKCRKDDIADIVISDKGFSNIILNFSVFDKRYVLRYPGDSASLIVSRKKEVLAQNIVSKAGIDNTLLYIDEDGCKIARYVDNCMDLSDLFYSDMDIMKKIVKKINKLHSCDLTTEEKRFLVFDPIIEGDRLLSMAESTKGDLISRFSNERSKIIELFNYMENDNYKKVLSHIDLNISNILLTSDVLEFIDWEFAGVTDPGFDFGRILDGYDPHSKEVTYLLEVYLGHAPSKMELRHFFGGVALHCWYFFCWCLYKESVNEDTSFYMTYFYHRAKKWSTEALALYKD